MTPSNLTGTTYAPIELVDPEDGELFATVWNMRSLLAPGLPEAETSERAAAMELTRRFLVAASEGCVFLSRSNPPTLVAYDMEFDPGPGHVLLDATADITGMTALMKGMEHVDVPAVDFSNLELFHLDQPSEFRFIPKVVSKRSTARPYANWIKETVVRNTEPGEDVLVVAHHALLEHEYLPRSEDPDTPVDWEGRRVNVIHWGIGIGSNKYKNKTVVFLFSEFHVPRRKTISNVHGWTGRVPTTDALNDASKAEPQGHYLTASEGHLLRWTKQLACRGNVRNIDAEGKCGKMRLFTSMDFARLTRAHRALFPGCSPPILVPNGRSSKKTKVETLCRLLAMTDQDILWSNEVEQKTAIKAHHLSQTINESTKVQNTMTVYGWSLVSAKTLGQKGKRKALAKISLLEAAA